MKVEWVVQADALEHIIAVLAKRSKAKESVIEHIESAVDKENRLQRLSRVHDAIYRMRALHAALAVDQPTGRVH